MEGSEEKQYWDAIIPQMLKWSEQGETNKDSFVKCAIQVLSSLNQQETIEATEGFVGSDSGINGWVEDIGGDFVSVYWVQDTEVKESEL